MNIRLTMNVLFCLVLLCAVAHATDETPAPAKAQPMLSPEDIIENGPELMNQQNTVVRFQVASILKVPTHYPDGSEHEVLHLAPNRVDGKFTASIEPEFLHQLQSIGIDDISKHFVGKTVTVQGHVSNRSIGGFGSPVHWTYHIALTSCDNVLSVTVRNQGSPANRR